jgi:hypothetical protein
MDPWPRLFIFFNRLTRSPEALRLPKDHEPLNYDVLNELLLFKLYATHTALGYTEELVLPKRTRSRVEQQASTIEEITKESMTRTSAQRKIVSPNPSSRPIKEILLEVNRQAVWTESYCSRVRPQIVL